MRSNLKVLNELISIVCKRETAKERDENPNSSIVYEVLTKSSLSKDPEIYNKIYEFYNHNWLGNVEFMHIPDIELIMKNSLMYPIVIAKDANNDEIIGIATIKYDENNNGTKDPYYPVDDAKYLSITGILVRMNSPHRGIGKKIYEIAIKGAYQYNKIYPNTKITCIIDCRNRHSYYAISKALRNIDRENYLGEGYTLPANLEGFYELRDENGELEEAPTFILAVDLAKEKRENVSITEKMFDFHGREDEALYDSLKDEIRRVLSDYQISSVQRGCDGTSMVHTYLLERPCSIDGTIINSNKTEIGNDRKETKAKEKVYA